MTDLDRADHLIVLGRAAEAEDLCRRHLTEQPDSAEALWLLNRALNKQRRWHEAVPVGRAALAVAPETVNLRITLVDSLIEVGQVEEARQIALGSVHLAPHDWSCRYSLTQALLGGRRPLVSQALEQANECVRLAPNSPDAHNLAGLCLDRLGLSDQARVAYAKALELDPQHALAMNNLATLDIGVFRLRRASRGFSSALALEPDAPLVQENLRVLMWRLSYRLFLTVLGAAAVVGILVATTDTWLPRALVGCVLLVLCGWLAESSRRALPRGISRSWRAIASRLGFRGWCYAVVVVFALVCVCAMAFAPHAVAVSFGLSLLVVLRILGLLVIVTAVIGAVVSLFRR